MEPAKFKLDDKVTFTSENEVKEGTIFIVDRYGTFEQNVEPSYDILVESENCLYKHIVQSKVKSKNV